MPDLSTWETPVCDNPTKYHRESTVKKDVSGMLSVAVAVSSFFGDSAS